MPYLDVENVIYSEQELWKRFIELVQEGALGGVSEPLDDLDIEVDQFNVQQLLTRLIDGLQNGEFV